jgi:hypothetical protein
VRRARQTELLEQLSRKLDPANRYVDCAVQLQVWRCVCGLSHAPSSQDPGEVKRHTEALRRLSHEPTPSELLPRIYGGKYDRLTKRYVGRADKVVPLACHEGQLPLLTFDEPGVLRVLAIGSPGAGKTFGAVRKGLIEALKWANTIGALVAPTGDRRQILWRDFLELVEPLGWVEDVSVSRKEITLVNRTVIQVLAAKAPSAQHGNPLQGRSWDWVVPDESQNISEESHAEIAARGRRAGKRYRIYETATNAEIPSFRVRLEELKTSPQCRIIRFTGHQNPWIDPEWWERLRGDMTDRRFRQFVMAEDVPPELLLYPEFEYRRHVADIPKGARDITAELAFQSYRYEDRHWIAAQDFGRLVTCTVFLKCYEVPDLNPQTGGVRAKRVWFALDEITSGAGVTADIHARRILDRYDAGRVLVIADPHFNTKDSDKSDYALFQQQDLKIVPAYHGRIAREHRYSMVNILLRDDQLFVGRGRCKKLVESFMGMQRNDLGEGEKDKKDRFDLSHWTAALGYGLFPFEKIRGVTTLRALR